jgi:two-component system, cell cycle response regulator DivK
MLPDIPSDILKNLKIVVVDDDPGSLDVANIILLFYGAEVHTATNGAEGFELATSVRPDFIITDLSMPVMDGWTLLGRLREDTRTIDIPAIALTAHAMLGDRERAIAHGFHNYLTKPLTPNTFIRDLLSLLVDIPEIAGMLKQA